MASASRRGIPQELGYKGEGEEEEEDDLDDDESGDVADSTSEGNDEPLVELADQMQTDAVVHGQLIAVRREQVEQCVLASNCPPSLTGGENDIFIVSNDFDR